jgi:hypothetical protein
VGQRDDAVMREVGVAGEGGLPEIQRSSTPQARSRALHGGHARHLVARNRPGMGQPLRPGIRVRPVKPRAVRHEMDRQPIRS